MVLPWLALLLFMMSVLLLTLYVLAASGHFPAEFRALELKSGSGGLIMWGTMLLAFVAGLITLVLAWQALPWYAILIGGGMILLLAPLLLQALPDSFVNGRASLISFSLAALTTVIMWAAA